MKRSIKLLTLFLLAATWLPGAIAFTAVSQGVNASSGTSLASSAQTTTAGNLQVIHYSEQRACTAFTGADTITDLPTNAAGTPVVIPGSGSGGALIGAHVSNGGSGYTLAPTVNVVGGGGTGAVLTASVSGGVVTTIQVSTPGSGYTSVPTLTFTPTSGGSGAAGEIVAIGLGGTQACMTSWYVPNITAQTNNTVTVTTPTAVGAYRGIIVYEFSGADTTAPFDVGASATATATSITSSSFTTSQADTVMVCESRVEALTQTWTVDTNYLPTGGYGAGTGANTFMSSMYQIFSSTQTGATATMSSGGNAQRIIRCAAFKAAAGGGGPILVRRKPVVMN